MFNSAKSKFSSGSLSGCKRMLALFIILMLLCSFIAQLISSDFGKVKIESISIDARGALLSGELYYPAGTSDHDSLPCVVMSHGGAISHTCMRGIAEELACRGFVVVNLSSYGAGISEQPKYDDMGQGIEVYSVAKTSAGVQDMLAFARTLQFVDPTRVALAGHSMGSIRVSFSAMEDCGYLTFNDTMINVLCDEFGQSFSEEEIYEDADALAQQRLDSEQLKRYEIIRAEKKSYADTRLKSIMVFGAHATEITTLQTVTVGGYEVQRNCQVNMGVLNGAWDDLSEDYRYHEKDYVKEGWYTNGENVRLKTWYALDDENQRNSIVGDFSNASILNNNELAQAIDNRTARVCIVNKETHGKNFFSVATTADIINYFQQTLAYNGGELGSADAKPIDPNRILFQLRATFNILAFFAMVCCFIPLISMLLKTNDFSACELKANEGAADNLDKRKYYILGVVTIVATFCIQYYIRIHGSNFHKKLPHGLFPLANSAGYQLFFLIFMGIFSLIVLVLLCLSKKKKTGSFGLENLNLWPGVKTVFKFLLLGLLMLLFGYLSLMVINYLFNQEFRFWQISFSTMKADYWAIVLSYCLLVFPACFLNGALLNYTVRKDIPQWKDTLISVIINSLGIYIIFFVNIAIAAASFDGSLFCSFSASHPLLIMIPLTTYIARKMYNMTKSIWVGATINTLLICWATVSSAGIYNYYIGQSWLSTFLGL